MCRNSLSFAPGLSNVIMEFCSALNALLARMGLSVSGSATEITHLNCLVLLRLHGLLAQQTGLPPVLPVLSFPLFVGFQYQHNCLKIQSDQMISLQSRKNDG